MGSGGVHCENSDQEEINRYGVYFQPKLSSFLSTVLPIWRQNPLPK